MDHDFTGMRWFEKHVRHFTPRMRYDPKGDFDAWRAAVREKIVSLLGDMPDHARHSIEIVDDARREPFREIRFVVATGDDAFPCVLTVPHPAAGSGEKAAPLLLCVQGHMTGMHMSLGRPENGTDEKLLLDHMDFAVQAAERGIAALLVEMRFMGERRFEGSKGKDVISCYRPAMGALLTGRTAAGLRVADLRAAISALPELARYGVRTDRVVCLGHSGGGTAAFFAACVDERVDALVVSCALCEMDYSILHTEHCSCNYIPGFLKYLDMSDAAGAIFPRPIVSLGGIRDDIFLIGGVEKAFDAIARMYAANGAPGRCVLLKGDGGHVFFPDLAWPEVERLVRPGEEAADAGRRAFPKTS